MLSKLRNFSKSKMAIVLVGIIIVPFVFWGMGSVFSSGNTNSIAKINNNNISTKDFIDHINSSNIDPKVIKSNIEKNIIEELLSELISIKIIELEVKNLNLTVSDKSLKNKIISNQKFLDENKKFSRVKYEKFLLENNITAPMYELRFKNNELKKNLFNYISGGLYIPNFLSKELHKNEARKLSLKYINLESLYKNNFTENEINTFIDENTDELKRDYIDLSYVKIYPKDLIQIEEYSNEFFKKIDEIENEILNGEKLDQISKKYNFEVNEYKKFNVNEKKSDEILNQIFSKRSEEKIQLIDNNDYFLLYEIYDLYKELPKKNDVKFIKQVKENLLLKEKFDFNRALLEKISKEEFKDNNFSELAKKTDIKFTEIESINDDSLFDINSIKLLYSLPLNQYAMISDKTLNIYLSKITKIEFEKLSNESNENKLYKIKTKENLKKTLFSSYDLFINSKYNVKINENTLNRVKNYFK